jgi:hypothetical protein
MSDLERSSLNPKAQHTKSTVHIEHDISAQITSEVSRINRVSQRGKFKLAPALQSLAVLISRLPSLVTEPTFRYVPDVRSRNAIEEMPLRLICPVYRAFTWTRRLTSYYPAVASSLALLMHSRRQTIGIVRHRAFRLWHCSNLSHSARKYELQLRIVQTIRDSAVGAVSDIQR